MTQSEERQSGATFSPDGAWVIYQQDTTGDEFYDLYAVPALGGEVVNLTQTPYVREMNPRWSPDGKMIAMQFKPKDGTTYSLELLDWASRKTRALTHEPTLKYNWDSAAWSPDCKTLYATRGDLAGTDASIFAIEISSGATTELTPHHGSISYSATGLSPDGKTLLITSNAKLGYQNVALLDVASKKLTWVTDTSWEATSGDFAPDGKHFTYMVNADGQIDVFIVDAGTLKASKIPVPAGLNGLPGSRNSFSPDGGRLLVSHETSVQPGDIWIYDLASQRMTQLTYSSVASLASVSLPASQIVHYKSFDGTVISALLWLPFNLGHDGSNPAVVVPHGGPTSQTMDYFSPNIASLVLSGYIVIAPNVRGSTGYGMAFQNANHQDLGGGDLMDEVYAVKFLEATGYVNSKKIGISGGSYGGFMALMAVGKTPDIWAAAVEKYGIIDWMTMLQHSDPLLQEYEKSLLGDPVSDRKIYEAASPIKYIHQVKAPLLVLQGEKDPRVPKEEADQVVTLLQKEGKTVEAHYYANEGHGFAKRENQIDAIHRSIAWFDKYLKSPGKGISAK